MTQPDGARRRANWTDLEGRFGIPNTTLPTLKGPSHCVQGLKPSPNILPSFMSATDRFAKTIIFCVDQEHALEMRSALAKLNA